MERRVARVSESQWNILLDFLERHPNLARARCYNNTPRGRAESSRLWSQVAKLLNAERSGTTKSPKDWSVYVSNFKSKLRRTVAGLNTDSSGTGECPSAESNLSITELRFLTIMGQGSSRNDPVGVMDPLSEMKRKYSTVKNPPQNSVKEEMQDDMDEILDSDNSNSETFNSVEPHIIITAPPNCDQTNEPAPSSTSSLPRRTRPPKYRSSDRPITQALRILSRMEMRRTAADMANAQANNLIAQNLGRLASAVERYLSHIGVP